MSNLDLIKSKIDILDLVSEAGVKLRKTGRNHTGFCPFHENKHSPAFVVWPETGTWRCFGACNEGGDIFKFTMKREGLDFKEALQKLALRAGVELETYQPQNPEIKEINDHLRELLEEAVVYYRSHLFNNKEILNYLHEKRGLTDSTIETFGLGYAPQGYDNALKHFTAKGYTVKDLIDSGMLSVKDPDPNHDSQQPTPASRTFDRFRNRIMIPIRDENGKMAGFGARIVDPNDIPKFLNSPETPIFTKGHILYGLDRARKPIRMADQAVIVEGYLDVIALHQAGYENVVSPMGTAITEDQLRLLKKSSRRIVLALDPDTAGQRAVLRGLDAARSAMDREGELAFDARGLLKNEARLQADLRVASMPDDMDPDEIVARDKDEWKRLIENAKPIVTHVMDALVVGKDINNPKIKNEIAAQILPLIEDLPTAMERETYRQALARMLKVNESALVSNQPQVAKVKRPRSASQGTIRRESVSMALSVSSGQKVEEHTLAMLLRKPELLYRLDRSLQEHGLTPLAAQDFDYTDHQFLFEIVRQSVEQDKSEHRQFLLEAVPETLQALSQELMQKNDLLDSTDDKLLEELLRGIIKLRRGTTNENLNQLKYMQEEARELGDLRAASVQEMVMQHARLLHDLDKAGRKITLKRLE